MVIRVKLTPEAFLSAPRRGPAVPSPGGPLAFFTESKHTFGSGTKKEVRLLELGSGKHWQLTDDDKVHDVGWVPGDSDDTLIWLRSADKGQTEVTIALPTMADKAPDPYVAAVIPAPIQALKMKALEDGSVACAVIGLVGADGDLHNEETAEKEPSTGRVYDDWHVREWDTYAKPQRYAIWYSRLVKEEGRWKLDGPLQNALRGTSLEAPDNMYEPDEPADAFDVAETGIVFVARDPSPADPVKVACSSVYFAAIGSFSQGVCEPRRITLQGNSGQSGFCSNPRFSPDGSMIAFLMSPFRRPADTRLHMGHVGTEAFDVFRLVVGDEWHTVPSGFEFAPSGGALFLQAEDCGRASLFELELRHRAKPRPLVRHGSISAHYPVRGANGSVSSLLVSGSSLVESSYYAIVDLEPAFEPRIVATAAKDGARYGLSHGRQVSEIYFEGGGDYCVQAWVVRPSDFDEAKKYPVVLMIHGGPESAWLDMWHMRWNPAVWAEQGYVVVLPNITGSTGFGVAHTTRIYGSWGGLPYKDLENCMEHLKNIPYIDTDRAIVAGGSYGGYMVNWINGQPLGKKFKAAVSHDSVFNTATMALTSDEPDGTADFRGPAFPWLNFAELDRWNPARPDLLRNWATHASPTLVVHSDRDFRCPVTEGLAVFKTLQFSAVPSRLLTFPDENHWVAKPDNALHWHRVVFDWINKYSGVAEERAAEAETVGGEAAEASEVRELRELRELRGEVEDLLIL